jgi:hypothetical protein
MNVMMWDHCTFESQIFGCGKAYYTTPFLTVGLKMSSSPILALKSPNSFHIVFREFIEYML